MTAPWREFLDASDREMRRNETNRGLAFDPDPNRTTIEVVAEYVAGFGWNGVGAREIVAAVQRDERGVKRALATLVEDGRLRVEESLTRGPKASRRKVYHPPESPGPVTVSLPEFFDHYGTLEARQANEYGAGGGREILPRIEYEKDE